MTPLVIDCTELYQNPVRTGIQRVVRELLRHWPQNRFKAHVARFDPAQGLVSLPDQAIRILTDQEHGAAEMSRDALVNALGRVTQRAAALPAKPRVFVPEVFYDHARCRFYEDRPPAMLLYDFLPWLRPGLFASSTMAGLMPYLRLLRKAPDVAFISQQTMLEYETRIAKRMAPGPVLPLGADGLRVERQTWHAGRTGYVSLGSLDTRKNQHIIAEAFIRLWQDGHRMPLTLIGGAFEGHKLKWLNEARRFPLFKWLDNASDKAVADAMRGTRAMIYVSEAEGYGLPPVESLAAGVPAIAAASCPSVAMLPPAGMIRLEKVTPATIGAAVLSLENNTAAAVLWEAAAAVKLETWQGFAEAAAAWLADGSYGSSLQVRVLGHASDAPAQPPTADAAELSSAEIAMNFAEMYAWWNQAALDNPMTAILSNHQNWDPAAFFETGRAWLGQHRAFANSANVTINGRRALDFGCGIGRMTAALGEHFDSVVGIDISEEMVRLARQHRRTDKVEFIQVKQSPLPFGDQEFDCVYSTIVVQHIPFPHNLNYVSEFFRISADTVMFDAPSHLHPGTQAGPGIFMLRYRDVLDRAEQSGFELIALRDFPATESRHYQYLFRRVDKLARTVGTC